jgi:hypothetical protein
MRLIFETRIAAAHLSMPVMPNSSMNTRPSQPPAWCSRQHNRVKISKLPVYSFAQNA